MVETEGSRQSSRPNKGQPAKRLAEENSSSSESEYEPSYKQQPKKKKGPTTNNKNTNSSPTTKDDSVPITNPPSANASNVYSIVAKIAIVYYCNNFNIIPSSILVIYINENTDLVRIFY